MPYNDYFFIEIMLVGAKCAPKYLELEDGCIAGLVTELENRLRFLLIHGSEEDCKRIWEEVDEKIALLTR